MRRYLFIALAAVLLVASAFGARVLGAQVAGAAGPCQFQKSASTVAFCDTFDQAAASNSTRSGALNPTVWGVSYISVLDNPSQGMDDQFVPATAPAACGGGSLLPPANVQICGGKLFDSVDDGGSQSILAMYPRQPFDIAGRTGDVTFDVSNDSLDSHAAWPTFVYTDQPVPAPYSSAAGINANARNSIGFTMAGQVSSDCPTGQWSVDTMFKTTGYALSSVPFTRDGCVTESSNPTVMSHVEVQISGTSITVWASNAGTSNLVEIANASTAVPLTRGLIWMEDTHYNAGKYTPGQRANTFGWDNVGFDGPILARDRGFDVPVNTQTTGGAENTGWGWNQSLSVSTLPVDATSRANAQAALVEFNWYAYNSTVPTISLNGNAPISTAWPFPDGTTYSWRTIAVPVPLSEVVQGANTITVEPAPNAEGSIADFDLILAGAGGVPTCLDPSNCSTSSTPVPTPSPTHSSTPTPTPAPPTPTPTTAPTSAPPPPSAGRLPIGSSQVYANGVDLPWINYGNDIGGNAWGEYGFHADAGKLSSDFTTMQQQGITTARVWLFADARGGITFNSSGQPTGLDPEDMADLDALTSAAAAHNVHLDLVLFDASFMYNATNLGNGVSGGGHSGLINAGSGGQALEQNVVLPVLKHLANNPAVFSIETMNEPEGCISDDHSLNSLCSSPVTLANFNAWTSMVARDVHATDPRVLVTVGSASSTWVGQYKSDGLDYYQLHDYYDGYAPNVSATLASSLGLGKPIVVGEYPANANTATFKSQMDAFYAEGYAGAWAWSFGDVDSVGTYNGPTMTAWNQAHPATQVGTSSTPPPPTPTPTPKPTSTPTPTAAPTPNPTPTPKHHHPPHP